jgi:hypothetical protein
MVSMCNSVPPTRTVHDRNTNSHDFSCPVSYGFLQRFHILIPKSVCCCPLLNIVNSDDMVLSRPGHEGDVSMRDIAALTDLYPVRALEMQSIAKGIWDLKERNNLLEFIKEYERMGRELRNRDRRVILPMRPAAPRSPA